MTTEMKFETPHDVYEKLLRDSKKLKDDFNCDNMFNFLMTAHYLKEVLKKSPSKNSAVIDRLVSKLSKDRHIQLSIDIAKGKKGFTIRKKDDDLLIILPDEFLDGKELHNEIMKNYESYFKIK